MTTVVPSSNDQAALISSLFTVEFTPVGTELFTEVSGLSMDIEEVPVKYVNANQQTVTRYVPGTVKYATITLKRQFTGDKKFWLWHQEMAQGKQSYSDGSIVLFALDGTEMDRWSVGKAWPSKWSVSDLDASSDDPITEEIEMQIEYLERVK